MKQVNVWEYIEQAPDCVLNTKQLFQWGLNHDPKTNPWRLFLDIIQFSQEHYATNIYEGNFQCLGPMDVGYLADALNEWACNPRTVEHWITNLYTYH
jgi:hypothetical protein